MQSMYFQERTERTVSSLASAATATLNSMADLHELSTSMSVVLYAWEEEPPTEWIQPLITAGFMQSRFGARTG